MPKKVMKVRGNPRRTSLRAACAVAILLVALAGCGGGGDSRPVATTDAHTSPAGVVRTVSVFNREPAKPSPSANNLRAGLVKGQIPGGTVKATVLSDENCAPDEQGISHCLNRVRLPDGQTVTVRHPHNMNDVPCLVPGEKVLMHRG